MASGLTTQYTMRPILLCEACDHSAHPEKTASRGYSGDITCDECGSAMMLAAYRVVTSKATIGDLSDYGLRSASKGPLGLAGPGSILPEVLRCRGMSEEVDRAVGEALRLVRKQKKLSIEDAAKAANTAERSLYAYERGEVSPTMNTVVNLAAVYDVSPKRFIPTAALLAAVSKTIKED